MSGIQHCDECLQSLSATHTLCMVCGNYFVCAYCCELHCNADHTIDEQTTAISWWRNHGTPLIKNAFSVLRRNEPSRDPLTPKTPTYEELWKENDLDKLFPPPSSVTNAYLRRPRRMSFD